MYRPSFAEFQELAQKGNLVPVYREILADEETPVSALMKIRRRPYAFLRFGYRADHPCNGRWLG